MKNRQIYPQNNEPEVTDTEKSSGVVRKINNHKIRKVRRPPIRQNNSNTKFSFFGGRPGHVFPTNYAELLYRRRNGRTKFEQAVRKKRIINILVGVSVAVALTFFLILALSVVTFIIIKVSTGSTKVVNTVSGNYSKVYVSTDSNQISNLFFQIVQRSVSTNSSLYLSFVDYNITYNGIKARYVTQNDNNIKVKRNVFNVAAADYTFVTIFEQMVNNLSWVNKGFYLDGQYISILSYLNNVAVISTTFDDLEYMMVDLFNKSSDFELNIDLNGTKWQV